MVDIQKVDYSLLSTTFSKLFEGYKTLRHNFVICNEISRYTFMIKKYKICIDTHIKDLILTSFCAFSHNPNWIYMGKLFKIINDNIVMDEIELNILIDKLHKTYVNI